MAGVVDVADGVGDVSGFGLGEFAECVQLGVDVAVKVKQTKLHIMLHHIQSPFFTPYSISAIETNPIPLAESGEPMMR